MGCEAQMPVQLQIYQPAISTRKVGQGDLVFDVQLGFASGSVCARFEVCVQQLGLVPPWLW